MSTLLKQYPLYLLRWQLSSPILALCLIYLHFGVTWNTVIANFIGGLIFFWVDKFIFTAKVMDPQWEAAEDIICADCGKSSGGYRIIRAKGYDKTKDTLPEFRCERCSTIKFQRQKEHGIV